MHAPPQSNGAPPQRGYELKIRAGFVETDWQAIYDMREEESVRYNTMAIPFADPARFRDRWLTPNPTFTRLIAEACYPSGEARVAGMLGVHRNEELGTAHVADIGIQVATEFQGQRVGTALMQAACMLADNWLNLHRLELEVYVDNERAIALYRRFGFVLEATMPKYSFRDGAYVATHRMGRINPHHAAPAEGRP